ncbi:MAG: hypothetical protein DME42_01105 [Verrucomicrobia bacterium]|nr:MAG: hypothetical protein DME42_01105 [Verrucomicrobiota bacterium]
MIFLRLAPFPSATSVRFVQCVFRVPCGAAVSFFWGAHAPRMLSLAPRQRLFWAKQERHFGEAPKWTREARALPRLDPAFAPR